MPDDVLLLRDVRPDALDYVLDVERTCASALMQPHWTLVHKLCAVRRVASDLICLLAFLRDEVVQIEWTIHDREFVVLVVRRSLWTRTQAGQMLAGRRRYHTL